MPHVSCSGSNRSANVHSFAGTPIRGDCLYAYVAGLIQPFYVAVFMFRRAATSAIS